MIAPDTDAGRAQIEAFNQSLQALQVMGIASLKHDPQLPQAPLDLAELITAEGYPAILGQTHKDAGSGQYFSLPQGSRVIVIEHTGKELYIRNMHIQLL